MEIMPYLTPAPLGEYPTLPFREDWPCVEITLLPFCLLSLVWLVA